jgi:hypothetical protein
MVLPAQNPSIIIQYKNFKISYSVDNEPYVQRLLSVLDTITDRYQSFYGIEPKGVFSIEFPASPLEYLRTVGKSLPDWSNGVYIPGERRLVLKKPEWYFSAGTFEQVLAHEMSHLYYDARFKNVNTPLWFNEGLAEYLSGQSIGIPEGLALSNALFSGKLIPLMDIDSLLLFNEGRARLAYLESLVAIRFLESLLVSRKVTWSEFFNHIEEADFENSLKQFTGLDLIDFQLRWYRWLEEKYKWFIFLNWENLIWLFIIIVLIGALYAIKYRNKKILESWELDEDLLEIPEEPLESDFRRTEL